MAFDRNKYKATPLTTVQNTVQSTKQFDTYYGGGNGEFAPFYSNKDGVTVKRVLPAHIAGNSPYVPMLTAMLKCEVDDKNSEGKVIGKKIANKKIFIATLHGGYPYDIIEEYIKRVYELASQYQDKEERSRFLNPITGYRMGGGKGTWVPGIRPQLEYIYYALIDGKIYRDSLKPKQMEALNKESADLCAQNDTASVDMFSDPNTGFPIQYSRSKDDNGKTVETLKALPLKMGQGWEDYFTTHAVSDKVLEEHEKYQSLEELYVNCYKLRDFELALDGLKRFDESNNYNIFAQDDFLDMIENLQTMVEQKSKAEKPEEKPSTKESKPSTPVAQTPKKVLKKISKPTEPTDEEKLEVVNKEFIRQYGEGYEELELEGEELEEAYQLALKKEDLGYDIEHVPGWDGSHEETFEPEPEPKSKPKSSGKAIIPPASANSPESMNALDRIRAMRDKAKK